MSRHGFGVVTRLPLLPLRNTPWCRDRSGWLGVSRPSVRDSEKAATRTTARGDMTRLTAHGYARRRTVAGDDARLRATAHGCERRVHRVCTQSTCDSVHCYALFRVTVGTPFLNHL